ncbi:MAG: hypothetical protein QOJ29_3032 [Thermoleophilaceae bacterium]|jgi:hypothetical protein|nr:hypothetical protein [Thermoleophilaceae bacterium]
MQAGRMTAARVCTCVAAVAFALAPTAQAGQRADYHQMFTTSVPGASTGTDTQILYKNPNDPEAKPIPVRREVFTFPAGTTYDESVVPDCNASDLELMIMGTAACPPESWIGGSQDDTTMTGFPGAGETPIEVDAFDDAGVTVILGGTNDPPIKFVTRATRKGQVVTVDVPRTPGGPPDGENALRRVHHVFPPRSLGRHAFTRTPRKCPPSGVWTFKAQFTFADGAVENDVSQMSCTL